MPPDRSVAGRVRAVYERKAESFDRRRTRALIERGWLERFRALLPKAAPVLDLGCGAGEPIARDLIEAEHPVTGLDVSEPMLSIARARFPSGEWIAGDMRRLALGRRFGGIVAWDSFFHLTRRDQRAMFPVFARHLMPGGALLFTSGPEEGEVMGAVEDAPVYHASLSPVAYIRLLEANGLKLRGFQAEDPDCGGHTVWLARAKAQ